MNVNKALQTLYYYLTFLVTVSSSGLVEDVGQKFIQLKIIYNEDGKRSSIFTEMNLNQFQKFVFDLEKAKSSLDILL